jgi:hypothetical protein
MAVERERHMREQLAIACLALQALARRSRPWEQQRRIASLGMGSLRRLTALLLVGGEPRQAPSAPERP